MRVKPRLHYVGRQEVKDQLYRLAIRYREKGIWTRVSRILVGKDLWVALNCERHKDMPYLWTPVEIETGYFAHRLFGMKIELAPSHFPPNCVWFDVDEGMGVQL